MLILSCQQKPRETVCDKSIDESFNGQAAIFFHKPISGSTYQIFLFPTCSTNFDSKLGESSPWDSLGKGISFSITSDNPQFKTLYNNAKILDLKGRDRMAKNFRTIYYCFTKAEVLFDKSSLKKQSKNQKNLFSHRVR